MLTFFESRQLVNIFVNRVRTLTGKEIELDIEPDYKVQYHTMVYWDMDY